MVLKTWRQALEMMYSALAELEVVSGDANPAITPLEPLAGRQVGCQVLIESTFAWALLRQGDVTRPQGLPARAVERSRVQGEMLSLVDISCEGTALVLKDCAAPGR